ncbi:DDE-type integrase/transposase/recombinase [Chitinimonas viridis]|uniref:DDE-type integrase/transposase/recombinase n=1 Tax=Chitinimonas viridis TaxID=664880 RepID=A0ABT8B1J3_9NEIS|nr:Mu transposase C-terminal domain-containing protein [Chitinimonas viridis]MDN3575695.1 DDE-type integrase/transposase/recombinase [Chitinimonas viridis]
MNGFALRRNMDFEWHGGRFRIQQLNEHGQALLLREQDGVMQLVASEELLSAYSAGTLRQGELPARAKRFDVAIFGRPLSDLKPSVQREVKRRLHYLQRLEDYGAPNFTAAYLEPIISVIAAELDDSTPPSPTSIYRWWLRLSSTHDPRSLIPRFDRRGGKHTRQSDEVLSLLKTAIEDAYMQSPAATGADIYVRWKGKIRQCNRLRSEFDQLPTPSPRTCYRLLAEVEIYDRICLKEGEVAANRRLNIVMKGAVTTNILERVEVDHTPLDMFTIDDKTSLPLGRPILTVVLDHYSRHPLGYYLNFGGTSAHAVLSALRHAILPKRPPAITVPGLRIEHAWSCYGVMDSMVLDNGLEFHGNDLESVAFDLGIRLQYCPKRTPRFKGAIERFLKTLNYSFSHQMPGTSFARLADRNDYDPQKHALLTLSELVQVLEKWLIDIYAQTLHRGLGTTPWAKWHEGLSRRILTLPPDLQLLQRRIGQVAQRSLRRPGIELNGLHYNGPALQPILNRYGEKVRLKVAFDAADLGSIQVWAPDESDPVEVHAVDPAYANGLTLLQHRLIRKLVLENGRASQDLEALHEAKIQLADSIAALMSSRRQRDRRRAAAIHGKTSNSPKREIKVNESAPSTPSPRPSPQSNRPIPTAYPRLEEGQP